MCGIAGVVSVVPVEPDHVARMRDTLVHRGPDSAGLWSSPNGHACLGHRRLSVVDLSQEANQPFAAGGLVLVLNGEIYNFRALRRELEDLGATFRTSSDTEVLLEAYRAWGTDCLERLSGMFAFALWDEERSRLFCARDRAGEKPFYYSVSGGAFAFGSEAKALVAWPGFRGRLDWTAIADFLTLGFVPDPKSVWDGVCKLPPGHRLTVDLVGGELLVSEPAAYWDFDPAPDESAQDWEEQIREALLAAAREMAYADVPVGVFLSGGIDSSAVTAALARAGSPVEAYTVGFADEDFDERPWAAAAAAHCGVPHVAREVAPVDVESLLDDLITWHYDEPFNDYSYLPTYYVCREARRSITVALTGDGGDELFAGYGKYALLARRASVERGLSRPMMQLAAAGARSVLPGRARLHGKLLRYEQAPDDLLAATLVTGLQPAELRAAARGPLAEALRDHDPLDVVHAQLAKAPPGEVGLLNAMRYVDLKLTLAGGILTKVDRASMAVSLETRPVFLNRSVLDLAARIPPRLLATGGAPKLALRNAVRAWLPEGLVDRAKQGFAMPLGRWGRGSLRRLLEPVTDGRVSALVDPGFAAALAREHASGHDRTAALHSFALLERWLGRWGA